MNIRYYSISSSSKKHPNRVGITAVVVRYALSSPLIANTISDKKPPTHDVVVKQGQMTSYFERMYEHEQAFGNNIDGPCDVSLPLPQFYLPMYIRSSSFKLPNSHRIPVVMVFQLLLLILLIGFSKK